MIGVGRAFPLSAAMAGRRNGKVSECHFGLGFQSPRSLARVWFSRLRRSRDNHRLKRDDPADDRPCDHGDAGGCAGASDHVVLSESPPLHAALSLEARVVVAGADIDHLDGDLACMAKAIHHEAANQSLKGQLALAQLIMNRVKRRCFRRPSARW